MNSTKTFFLALAAVLLVACGNTDTMEPESGDARDASIAISDGRADSLGFSVSRLEMQTILDIANTYSFEDLDAFLDRRAAQNIVDARAEGPIQNVEQLDAIPWVGPRAFEALLEEARSFLGTSAPDFSASDLVEVRERETSRGPVYDIWLKGEVMERALEQPFIGGRLRDCDENECRFPYSFEELNDYTAEAEPGHVAVSFRTGGVQSYGSGENSNHNRFNTLARIITEADSDGPIECVELPAGRCIALYGPCGGAPHRCRIRLPE